MFSRKFGVEIETSSCPGHEDYDSCDNWEAKYDGSISGLEFASSVLPGYAGLSLIHDICDYAKEHNWEVDDNCGLHVHFDMRGESNDSLKAIALAYKMTYKVWTRFVDSDRIGNTFCKPGNAGCNEVYKASDFSWFAEAQIRYEWINFAAYNRHRTFEVRLHEGTLVAIAICNWIKAHAVFIDWAASAGWAKVRNTLICMDTNEKTDFIAQLWCAAGCEDVAEYYQEMVCA
jgi:hypothetical protein